MVFGHNKYREYIMQVSSRQLLLVALMFVALTHGRHGTDAESRRGGRETELIQYCIGPCWINHCDVTAGGRARNYPHRALAEKEGYGNGKDDWHDPTCLRAVSVVTGWHCRWWLECDCKYHSGRIMTDLPWPLLRSQVWLQQHSAAADKTQVRNHIWL